MKHTPFDGSHHLFRIGLSPLEISQWLEVDERLDFYLEQKVRLHSTMKDIVFVEEPDTNQAQREVLDLILSHLPQYHCHSHQVTDKMVIAGKHHIRLDGNDPALLTAASLVQEDLVIMRKGDNGWRLVAASVCFPSSWSLKEKFGKPLGDIHGPVPGFSKKTRNDRLIERIFDNLLVEQPVRRMNWSVFSDDELFHDSRVAEHLAKKDFDRGIFLRVEHQTLRKLQKSGDILFTIRIHVDGFERLEDEPKCNEICDGFISSLKLLDGDQLAYKGLTAHRDRLIDELERVKMKTQ